MSFWAVWKTLLVVTLVLICCQYSVSQSTDGTTDGGNSTSLNTTTTDDLTNSTTDSNLAGTTGSINETTGEELGTTGNEDLTTGEDMATTDGTTGEESVTTGLDDTGTTSDDTPSPAQTTGDDGTTGDDLTTGDDSTTSDDATTSSNDSGTQTSNDGSNNNNSTSSTNDDEPSTTLILVAIIGGFVVAVVILVIIAALILRKPKRKPSTKMAMHSLDVERNFSKFKFPELDENSLEYFPISQLPLKIQKLRKMVDKEHAIDGFSVEYHYIESETTPSFKVPPHDHTTANLSINRDKNRYLNVLPIESTRVKLEELDGEEGSDYVNANWVDGLIPEAKKAYIASQGPTEAAFKDFWRMIWDTECVLVLMLTKEVENGRLKCDQYWPDEAATYGYIKVFVEKVEENSFAIIRRMKIENTKESKTRVVTQYQYHAWPDHGVPNDPSDFLNLVENVDSYNPENKPIVIHCSAGIGRTGTFCMVHSILTKLKKDLNENSQEEPKINLIKTLLRFREQRAGMVQTEEQYVFCYHALEKGARPILESTKFKMVPLEDDEDEHHETKLQVEDENSSTETGNKDDQNFKRFHFVVIIS